VMRSGAAGSIREAGFRSEIQIRCPMNIA